MRGMTRERSFRTRSMRARTDGVTNPHAPTGARRTSRMEGG
jgi:hypothetical protein